MAKNEVAAFLQSGGKFTKLVINLFRYMCFVYKLDSCSMTNVKCLLLLYAFFILCLFTYIYVIYVDMSKLKHFF